MKIDSFSVYSASLYAMFYMRPTFPPKHFYHFGFVLLRFLLCHVLVGFPVQFFPPLGRLVLFVIDV